MFKYTAVFIIGAILLATAVHGQDVCDADQVQTLMEMGENFNTIVSIYKLAEEKDSRCGPDQCIRYYLHKSVQDNVDGAKALNGQNVSKEEAIPILFGIAKNAADLLTTAKTACNMCAPCNVQSATAPPASSCGRAPSGCGAPRCGY